MAVRQIADPILESWPCDGGHTRAHWQVTSTARGTLSPTSLWRKLFHVITQHHRAVLLNEDTFEREHTRRSMSPARSGIPRRPSRARLLLAFSAESLTRRAPTSRLPASTSTTGAPSGDPSVLPCCSWCATSWRSCAHQRLQQGCRARTSS